MICYYRQYKSKLNEELEKAGSFREIFALVQRAVEMTLQESRAGLNLAITELGNTDREFLGAFYPAGSNVIVLNSTPLRRITETNPQLFRPYIFHVLLHEYLHSLGYMDEENVRDITKEISCEALGEGHIASQMARNIGDFFPNLTYPGGHPPGRSKVLVIEDLDGGMDYID